MFTPLDISRGLTVSTMEHFGADGFEVEEGFRLLFSVFFGHVEVIYYKLG